MSISVAGRGDAAESPMERGRERLKAQQKNRGEANHHDSMILRFGSGKSQREKQRNLLRRYLAF